ncbi:MAG: haloacid dehalogenase type II [Proteobacteria bacterium]|nr:haloacid dehalogenase type II [Pseudomonadota bacterium]
MTIDKVQTLIFDTFGTLVDWRSSIIKDLTQWGKDRKLETDWAGFTDEWKTAYRPGMDAVNKGERDWMPVRRIYREKLDEILPKFGLGDATEADRHYINDVWYRLDPWADTVPGLERLAKKYVLSSFSNSDFLGMALMSKHAGLPFDAVLTAENAKKFKPDPAMYEMAIELLGQGHPERLMLVASHNYDLANARKFGMGTAFILRPTEYGPGQKTDLQADESWDVIVSSALQLAEELGC